MIFTRGVSLTNFLVASSALGFQAFVLYPWHKRLDEDFEALKKENLRVLQAVQDISIKDQKDSLDQVNERRTKSVKSNVPTSTTSDVVHVAKQATTSTIDTFSGIRLYTRYALAGALCCSFTHAVLTPIDVSSLWCITRGLFAGLRQAVAQDGAGSLLKGLGPTVAGYFLQGAFKFGGYELFKQQAVIRLGDEAASNNRYAIYLTSSAAAECLGSIALCPFEAVRIRLVSDPTFGRGLWDGFGKMAKQKGISRFYSGLGPILFKQVPYTMVTFTVYEKVVELVYKAVDKSTLSKAAI